MNDDLRPVVAEHRYDLEKVPGAVRFQVQDLAIVLVGSYGRMCNGVLDVVVADFMFWPDG